MNELEILADRTAIWHPQMGKEYWLGFISPRNQNHLLGGESTHAYYFGFLEGKHVFYRDAYRGLERFESPVGAQAVWWGGEDEPSVPAVPASRVPDMLTLKEQQYVQEKIHQWAMRELLGADVRHH